MANYVGRSRTNYFKVKDVEAFKEDMAKYEAEDLNVWVEQKDDETHVGFGGYSSLFFLNPVVGEDDDEEDGDEQVSIVEIVQPHLQPGEACILMEAGYEALRYVVGAALIITSDKSQYVNLHDVAVQLAGSLTEKEPHSFFMHN